MKNVLWASAQRVTKQILAWLQRTKEEAIRERYSDVFGDGVSENLLNNMAIVGKDIDNSLTDFLHIKVDTGVAYKSGERILIEDASETYDATNPNDTTEDGRGDFVSTPHSTGSFDIPLTENVINFVYIAYLQATDETEFTLHKLTNRKIFYKRTDGYEIIVNTTGTNPDSSRFIFLGEIDLTGSNQAIASTISIVDRDISRTKTRRVGIETSNSGKTDRPTSYSIGNQKLSLDDHIKSVGNGTITNTNPHGTAPEDIGISEDDLVLAHRRVEHQNGIIAGSPGNTVPTTSGLFVERVVQSLDDDFVRVKPLGAGELAIINGITFDNTDFPAEQVINFVSGTDIAGTYDIFFDSSTGQPGKILGSVVGDQTKLRLATITWDGSGNLGSPLDRRIFGTTYRMARWTTDGRPPNPFPGSFGFNATTGQAEYFNGSTWTQF